MTATTGGAVGVGNKNSFLDKLGDLGIDLVRARHIDSELATDGRNIRDATDSYYGASPDGKTVIAKTYMGITPSGWAIGGVMVVASLIALKAFKVF